ncbi:stage III sporulation protein AF [Paenibacillus sp. UMB4589-SE434]|uniref:stage III sporulation protein AF n=1 Tax=Paenibacillus sp. UMB4589-SE434 TaxID=3046314 RepID=UPI00254B9358|nr:stage III sporulation protein AF [Paenibacillus sp. UMB4589-SE434]MDK8179336.1 stage III sporulation protein AF [Paenibacillus sp. UMB4589-SE434]
MTWLSQWLKEIIMVILLATFIDLLLPNRTMQRYVKLMMSLIILLILLSPIMKLFDANITDELAQQWDQASAATPGTYASLTSIQREANRIKAKRDEQVMSYAAAQLETNMKKQLNDTLASPSTGNLSGGARSEGAETVIAQSKLIFQVVAVQVELTSRPNQEQPTIDMIRIQMKPAQRAEIQHETLPVMAPEHSAINQVEPVETVSNVTVQSVSSNNNTHKKQLDNQVQPLNENDERQAVEGLVKQQLSQQWVVLPEQIHIEWQT